MLVLSTLGIIAPYCCALISFLSLLFIYWLRQVLAAMHGLSSCGAWSRRRTSSVVVLHGLSCPHMGFYFPQPGFESASPSLEILDHWPTREVLVLRSLPLKNGGDGDDGSSSLPGSPCGLAPWLTKSALKKQVLGIATTSVTSVIWRLKKKSWDKPEGR